MTGKICPAVFIVSMLWGREQWIILFVFVSPDVKVPWLVPICGEKKITFEQNETDNQWLRSNKQRKNNRYYFAAFEKGAK